MTALVDSKNFDGNALVYLPQYLTQSSSNWAMDDEQVIEDCLLGLEKMYPEFKRSDVVSSSVARAKKVLAISTLDYSSKRRPPQDTSLANVSILNSAQIANGTLNVNETLGIVNDNLDTLLERIARTTFHDA